ncbi:hypothetical protein [Chryseobacterium sp. YIM B08800]|uniref:hypothetical protein n=1 Tax=Chryseobacterium sp. YIM B08800 TaxID=2984136 RepID=UPI00223F1CF7|nr:hypothetical protein [Chryseobacterium sp. YIM B08800]
MKKELILFLLIFISFKNFGQNNNCNENLRFKEAFFYHIKIVESNIAISQDETFRKSVIFIYNYAPVSVEHIMNYSRTYPIGVFKKDKIEWLKWYEENKCENIQIKTACAIPEVYQLINDQN